MANVKPFKLCEEELLTIDEFCKFKKIGKTTYYRQRNKGVIPPPLDVGGNQRHLARDLEDDINRQLVERIA